MKNKDLINKLERTSSALRALVEAAEGITVKAGEGNAAECLIDPAVIARARMELQHSVNQDRWLMIGPVLTNAHITQDDAHLLDAERSDGGPAWFLTEMSAGWLLYLNNLPDARELRGQGYSEAFIALLQQVNSMGYDYLRLDSDGDELPGIPKFNW